MKLNNDIIFSIVIRGLSVLISLALHTLILKKLGANFYGVFSFYLLLALTLSVFFKFGSDQDLIRKINSNHLGSPNELIMTYIARNSLWSLCLIVIFFTISSFFAAASFIAINTLQLFLLSLALALLICCLAIITEAKKGQGKVNEAIFLFSLLPFTIIGFAIYFAEIDTVLSAQFSFIIGYLISLTLAIYSVRAPIKLGSLKDILTHFWSMKYLASYGMVANLSNLFLNYLLLNSLSREVYGVISYLNRFIGLANVIKALLNAHTAQKLAQLGNNNDIAKIESYLQKVTLLLFPVSLLISIGVIISLSALTVTKIVDFELAISELTLLFTCIMLLIGSGPVINFLILSGNEKLALKTTIFGYIFIFFYWLIIGQKMTVFDGLLIILIESFILTVPPLILSKSYCNIRPHFLLQHFQR